MPASRPHLPSLDSDMTLPVDSLIPITISSGFDVEGEERIHAAKEQDIIRAQYAPTPYYYYAYNYSNLGTGSSSSDRTVLGYGRINGNTGEQELLGKILLDPSQSPSQTFNGGPTRTVSIGDRLLTTLGTSPSQVSGSIYNIQWDGATLSIAEKFKRTISGYNLSYDRLCYDKVNDILWCIEYQQLNVSPFTSTKNLVALRLISGSLTVLAATQVLSGSTDIRYCIHNGYAILYIPGASVYKAYTYNAGTINLVATSATLTSGIDDQIGNDAMSSDGTYIHRSDGQTAYISTFDGTTFTQVWSGTFGTSGTARGAYISGGLVFAKLTDQTTNLLGTTTIRTTVGGTPTTVSTLDDTELLSSAFDPTSGILLLPSYVNPNTSSSQTNERGGVYHVTSEGTTTQLNSSFILDDISVATGNDGRGRVFFVDKLE